MSNLLTIREYACPYAGTRGTGLTLADLTNREAVLDAMREYDDLGRDC